MGTLVGMVTAVRRHGDALADPDFRLKVLGEEAGHRSRRRSGSRHRAAVRVADCGWPRRRHPGRSRLQERAVPGHVGAEIDPVQEFVVERCDDRGATLA
jgi:hypothetical protein